MKALTSGLVLLFWISSWFPTSADNWAVFVATGSTIGLIAALRVQQKSDVAGWVPKAISLLVSIILIGGAIVSVKQWAAGTSADGAIAVFFVVGAAGYLLMIRDHLVPKPPASIRRISGSAVLLCLATWSWVSAVAMYVHRGADTGTGEACIIVARGPNYDTQLTRIWDMRLPEIATFVPQPRRAFILTYHAVLVVPDAEQTDIYNWSKLTMRFEGLDAKRNPYVPTTCQ